MGLSCEEEEVVEVGWERVVGSKRGSRDFKEGEGSRMVRLRVMAWRVERVCGACLEVRWWVWRREDDDDDDDGLKGRGAAAAAAAESPLSLVV